MNKREEKGITLIVLIITIILLLILAGLMVVSIPRISDIFNGAQETNFSAKIRQYQQQVDKYVVRQNIINGETVNITTTDKDEIKKIITDITDEDLEKYVIQNNELRYNPETVTDQEKTWLEKLGVLAMVTIILFTITYMVNGQEYQTVQSDTIIFPEVDPTSSSGNFAGWYYEEEGINRAVEGQSLTQDITLYAKWGDYVATFISDGVVYDTIEGNTLTFPTINPTSNSGNFVGCYYDQETTDEAVEGTTLTKNITLYAKYALNITVHNKVYYASEGSYGYPYYFKTEEDVLNNPLSFLYTGNQNMLINLGFESLTPTEINSTVEKYELVSAELVDGNNNPISVSIRNNGLIELDTTYVYNAFGHVDVKITYVDGSTVTVITEFKAVFYCLAEGTKITLAGHRTKNIENITYEDKLLVWDFDKGCFAEAKPLWIKKVQVAKEYNLVKFDNGVELKTVADHRIFNMESQKFTYTMNEEDTPLGTTTFMEDGTTAKLIERKVVKETVNYYNVITDYHMNLFANGILTSLRLNNLYKIENMKFVKDDRKLATREEYASIPDKYFYGLRLAEQPKEINRENDVKHTNTLTEYVERIMQIEK